MLKKSVRRVARRLGIIRRAADKPVESGEFVATIGRLQAEIAAARERIEALTDEALRDRDAVDARLEKLELLAEHPDSVAATCPGDAFPSPAVSVVMPTWNRASLIGAAIRSVQAQTFTDWELLVVDDGSTDDTKRIAETFVADRRIKYITQAHLGQAPARNRALDAAKGALIAYLDSDNLWYPEFLSVAVAAFVAMPDIDCAYGANVRDEPPRIMHEPFDRERLLAGNFVDMSALIHRRSLVERFGGFDERLQRLIDWDLVLRYTAHAPAYRLPVRAVRYRALDAIRVTDTQSFEKEFAIIRGKWNGDPSPATGQAGGG